MASGVRAVRLRSAFVVLQVALSLVLLIGAGLFLRTLRNAYAVDLGYRTEGVLLSEINLDLRGYSADAGQDAFRRIFERVATLPGVQGVGASRVAVLSGGARTGTISADGQPVARDGSNGLTVRINVVTDGLPRDDRYPDPGRPLVPAGGRPTRAARGHRQQSARAAFVAWPGSDRPFSEHHSRGDCHRCRAGCRLRERCRARSAAVLPHSAAAELRVGDDVAGADSRRSARVAARGPPGGARDRQPARRRTPADPGRRVLAFGRQSDAHGDAGESLRWARAAPRGDRPLRHDGARRRTDGAPRSASGSHWARAPGRSCE